MCKMSCQGLAPYAPVPRSEQVCRLTVVSRAGEQLRYPATVDLDTGLVTVEGEVAQTQGVIEFQPPGQAILEFAVQGTRRRKETWQVTWPELDRLRQVDAGAVRGIPRVNVVDAPPGHVVLPFKPTDDMIRRMLATHMPASFKHYLRHPDAGPSGAARDEVLIAAEIKRYDALIEGAQALAAVVAETRPPGGGGAATHTDAKTITLARDNDIAQRVAHEKL